MKKNYFSILFTLLIPFILSSCFQDVTHPIVKEPNTSIKAENIIETQTGSDKLNTSGSITGTIYSELNPLLLGDGFSKTKLYVKNDKLYAFVVNDEERLVGDWNSDFKLLEQSGYFSMGGKLYFASNIDLGPIATIKSDSIHESYLCISGISIDGILYISGKKQNNQISGKVTCLNSDSIPGVYNDSGVYILEIPTSGKLKFFPGVDGKSLTHISDSLIGDEKGNKLRSNCGQGGCEYTIESNGQ